MNSFIHPEAEARTSDFKISMLGNFKLRTAALAIGTIGAIMMSLVLASTATTSDDLRPEAASAANARKSAGKCKAPMVPTVLAM
ncbi:hypothetical protein [Bradyrhizobium sp. WYCCWR 12699]|uniref:hypothetical protein n=1 Tax=Bradyrhizobium sp. WYCCWR 12699 TaxID=3064203 RepID=UPI0028A3691E|nr:hypothetical protein [Bradyrhizobium sp. WYCCWR 12699]MDT4743144.1 hypothetical protein [Bradyrhizobium sp. WYCCWR 12699]